MRWNRIFCRPNIRKGLFLLVCSPAQWAANIPITIAGSTETQIAISYTPTSSGPCTITTTDNNGGPAVADLDAVKFANAASDTGRTLGNGFRWPTLANGPIRTVFIGGHDEIKQGLDGKWYSTALQVNTDHTITVTCNGGADGGTIHASTSNLPVASYYPEMPIATPGSPLGGMPQPTIDYSVPNYKVNDPLTGVLIQTVSQGTDNINDNEPRAAYWARDVVDVNGGAWTNAGNFITKRDSGNLATTWTANAPLFAAYAANWPDEWYTDLTVVPYGNAMGKTVISEWCLSTDSGQSCANYTPLDVMFSDGPPRAYRAIPSANPSSMFSGWGGMKVAYGTYDLVNRQVIGVSTSGHLVTATVAMAALGFNLDRVQGSKFKLSSCSTGSGGVFTVDHTDSEGQITMVESATITGCTYTDMASGVRVILKNSGTLNVSLSAWEWGARGAYSGTNGARWICARQKVNDIQTGCAGETHSPAIGGYLCGLGNQGIYVIQDDGKMCLQSDLYSLNTAPQYHLAPELSGEISPIDARSFLLQAVGQTSVIGHTVKMTHIANNYEAVPVDPTHTANDRFTYTDLTATTTPIATQIAKAGGEVARALGTGLWTPMGFDTVLDNGSGGATIQYRTQQGQDTPCMLAWADAATNTLLSTQPMYGGYPFSYAACHFSSQGAAGYSLVGTEAESSQLSPIFFNPSILLGGPFISRVTKVKKNRRFVDWSLSISGATNASPTVPTSASSDIDQVNAANASQGALMTCSGGAGGWAALNRSFYAHYVSANTFSLYTDPLGTSALDSSAFGSFTGQSIFCTVAPPVYSINVSSISNNGGNARITADTGYFAPFYPSGKLPMADGDPVAVNHGTMTSTTQYYAKVSSAPSGQFDLYTDAGLTSPVSFAAASRLGWGNGWGVTLAETCPDPATITLPGPMYMDTGFGTTGAGNQKVRCLWLRLNGEFCSDFAKIGEIAGYPCPGGGVHASQSMMHQIKVGDGMMSLRSSGNNHEISYVLQVDRSAGENQIDILVMRDMVTIRATFGVARCGYSPSSIVHLDPVFQLVVLGSVPEKASAAASVFRIDVYSSKIALTRTRGMELRYILIIGLEA